MNMTVSSTVAFPVIGVYNSASVGWYNFGIKYTVPTVHFRSSQG